MFSAFFAFEIKPVATVNPRFGVFHPSCSRLPPNGPKPSHSHRSLTSAEIMTIKYHLTFETGSAVAVGSNDVLVCIFLVSFAAKCKRKSNTDGYSTTNANCHVAHRYAYCRSDANTDTNAQRQRLCKR